jgi:CRP/FNR family transcriptional regulator, dissimilatory nitrate respiration regulator
MIDLEDMINIMPISVEAIWGDCAREIDLAAGEVLFRSGDRVQRLFLIRTGVLRLVRPLPHGIILTIQKASAGQVLAEASLFASAYHCDGVAATRAVVRSVSVKRAIAALESDPKLARSFSRQLAEAVQAARARAEIVSLRTVSARVDAWLALNSGELPARGRWRDWAEEISVAPEALYRELARRR